MKKTFITKWQRISHDNAYNAWCLALAYEDGWGYCGKRKLRLRKNKRLAFRWMLHAAELGEGDAMIGVASYLGLGYGCVQNIGEAIKWEKKALRTSRVDLATRNLACSYRMLRKYRLAVQWFKKAYTLDKDSAFELGKCYLFGQGVKKNTATALSYFREIASVHSDPITKIHAMKFIADIQCEAPPTTVPLNIRRMPLPVMEKRAECYKKELRRNPKNEAACWCLAQLYLWHHLFKDALPYLRKCRQLSFCPEDIIPWLAATYYELGMLKHEIELYESCLKSNPKDKWAQRRLKLAREDVHNE